MYLAVLVCFLAAAWSADTQLSTGPDTQLSVTTYPKDPDVLLDTPQLLRRHGYPSESHTIETADGYLLTLHRIPSKIPATPVFLQHGLLGSSADWVFPGPEKGLAYLLADEGYDVWLGNARGNTYSRAHSSLSPDDTAFWNFSWHEMGYHDLPAALDHILNVTGAHDVLFCGHSMGTTMFYVMASTRPEYNSKVRAMYSLAPIAFMKHVKSPIRLLAPFAHDVEFLSYILGSGQFLPQNKITRLFAKYGCELIVTEEKVCENFIFLIVGFDAPQFNMTLLPVVLSHTPAGTSTMTLVHYAQEIQSGKFQQFDYGKKRNMEVYKQPMPPAYDLSIISVPIELHYASNDWLAHIVDVEDLYASLKQRMGKYLVKLPGFNHLDFLWAKDVKSLVYNKLIGNMKKMAPPSLVSGMLKLKDIICKDINSKRK